MKKILYKNSVGSNNKRKDLCIREVVTQNGVITLVERRCRYFIRDKVYIEDPNDLKALATFKENGAAWKKKHFHILRNRNSATGEDRMTCKIAGTLYAIVGHYIFCIAFIHLLKIGFEAVPLRENKT